MKLNDKEVYEYYFCINYHLCIMCLHWPAFICANIYNYNTLNFYTITM